MTNITKKIENDPILVGLNKIFSDIQEDILNKSNDRLNLIRRNNKNIDFDMLVGDIHNLEDDPSADPLKFILENID